MQSTGTQYIDTQAYKIDAYTLEYKCTTGNVNWRLLCYARSDSKRSYGVVGQETIMLCVKDSGYVRSSGVDATQRHTVEYSVEMGNNCIIDGVKTSMPTSVAANSTNTFTGELSMFMFANNVGTGKASAFAYAYVYSCTLIDDTGKKVRHFVPALDPSGEPCMFDTVSKQPFTNDGSGQFIAGFTLAQAAQLGRKLPSTGGSLTVSLPEGYEQNERVVESLTQAEAKGWVLTVQTYAAETAAATFAIRRVWCRRSQDENGSYVAADGSRWLVEWCVDVIGADPESLGYERFRSVEVAAEYWGLTEYVYPETETIES